MRTPALGTDGIPVPWLREPLSAGFGNEDETCDQYDGSHRDYAQDSHDGDAVFTDGRVVLEAVQENVIRKRAEFSVRCLDQAQFEICRVEFDAIEVLRDNACRGQHDNAARMSPLFRVVVIGIAEADLVGQLMNRVCGPGQEVPAFCGGRSSVVSDV